MKLLENFGRLNRQDSGWLAVHVITPSGEGVQIVGHLTNKLGKLVMVDSGIME